MDTTLRKGSEAKVRSVGPRPGLGPGRPPPAPLAPGRRQGTREGLRAPLAGRVLGLVLGRVPSRAGRWGNFLVGCRWVLTAQAPLINWVSPFPSLFGLGARLGKWFPTSSTLEPATWPGGLSSGTYRERAPLLSPGPLRRGGARHPLGRSLPAPRGAPVRAPLGRGRPQCAGDPSSPGMTLLAPKDPLFLPGTEAPGTFCTCDPDAQGIQATGSFKLLCNEKRKQQTNKTSRMKLTQDGGAEPGTVSVF